MGVAEGRLASSWGCVRADYAGALAGRGDAEERIVVVAGAGDPGDAHFFELCGIAF